MKSLKNLVTLVCVVVFLFVFGLYVGNVLSIGRCIGGESIVVKSIVDGQEVFQRVGASGLRQLLEVLFDAAFILIPIAMVPILYAKSCATYKQLEIGTIAECDDITRLDNCLQMLLDDNQDTNSVLVTKGLDTDCRRALNNTIDFKQDVLRNYMRTCKTVSTEEGISLACCAAFSVVLSPTSVGDTLCLLFWNIRAINMVLKTYNLRPGALALLRIYGEVLLASFTVGSIDDVLESVSIPGFGKGMPFLSQFSQAAGTLYSIFRTVSLTQYFVCHGITAENRKVAKREARIYAIESLKSFPESKQFRSAVAKAASFGMDTILPGIKNLFDGEKSREEVKPVVDATTNV